MNNPTGIDDPAGIANPDPTARVAAAYARIAEVDRPEIWIDLRPREEVLVEAARIDAALPLAGRVIAVKGNIDVAGLPTTAGCPSYAYRPERDAAAVARLRAAGAIVLGTTNLDQFATGLVGTRSPYGAVRGTPDPDRIAGGSSSGSAVAVALGIVDLALGTDTAGSGRVPAALNGIVGIKPTRGAVSTVGVVPACRSLDCVSVFARTVDDAEYAYALLAEVGGPVSRTPGPYRIGVPAPDALGPLTPGWARVFATAAARLATAGARLVPIDLEPFDRAARMLYDGAFVAERFAAVGAFTTAHADAPGLDPTVAGIIGAAGRVPAHRLFADLAHLDLLRTRVARELYGLDALLLPTTTDHPTLAEVAADPIGVSTRLGRFTNSTNLLDLCAIAVPAGRVAGLPFGVMLVGPAGTDAIVADIARALAPARPVAVVGAHLSGQPLHHQLADLGGYLAESTHTAPDYRLYALPTDPAKPGLVRVPDPGTGAAIEAEVWDLPAAGFAAFVAAVPPPMTIGAVTLADGSRVPGFLCEPAALAGAADITETRSWRAHLARTR